MDDNAKDNIFEPILNYARDMFEMFVQKQWLKEINRQLASVNRAIKKARQAKQRVDHKRFVLQKLIDEYNARYDNGLSVKEVDHDG